MKKDNLLIIFLVAMFGIYAWLRFENSQYIHEPRATFGDAHEYFDVSSFSITSSSFWIAVRPPTIPLLFKIIGTDASSISKFQLGFSMLAWGILALTFIKTIRSYLVKPVAFSLILAFSLSQDVIMWDYLIISESVSISIMILFFSAAILLLEKWTWARLLLFGIIGIFFVFTRDAFAYLLLMVAVCLFLLVFFSTNKRKLILVGVYLFFLYFCSNALASASMRWYPSLLNTVAMRILPNPEYVEYFQARGMPIDDALMERSGKHAHADDNALGKDPRFQDFLEWTRENGRKEYIRFLWFYKADALQNIFGDIQLLISPDLYYYSATGFRPVIRDMRFGEVLYPSRFGLFILLVANLVASASFVWALYERRDNWLLPILLILLAYPQSVFIWNADTNEIGRHSIYHNIQWRLGLWLLILYAIDFVIEKKIFVEKLFAREKKNSL